MVSLEDISRWILEFIAFCAVCGLLSRFNKRNIDESKKRNIERYGFDKFPSIDDLFKKK